MNTQILDFWVGNFNSEEEFDQFIEEDENYYLNEEDDDNYISKFAESQDTVWFDNDLAEYGFENLSKNIYENFSEYSFADQWLPELVNKINELELKFEINSLLFVSQGQIPKPVSVEAEEFSLVYLGGIQIEY
ncbi:immunity 22 family protein [Chryseobacterium chendengshani]|uniref:immunity 22 family protein n=1 Tax=Chryseobacterium sp. LJ668 TaxID=2864040 RepID=UPI001C687A18|nr:immunity 22 family protein [Chryseobacterium sp. LJ668]MBW8524055.1 immunity 22 family protein [Chryseobacterium sp. LJ668]QYK16990.1 immunity 22 family protein [Chryseobacterium sp. LJ668]